MNELTNVKNAHTERSFKELTRKSQKKRREKTVSIRLICYQSRRWCWSVCVCLHTRTRKFHCLCFSSQSNNKCAYLTYALWMCAVVTTRWWCTTAVPHTHIQYYAYKHTHIWTHRSSGLLFFHAWNRSFFCTYVFCCFTDCCKQTHSLSYTHTLTFTYARQLHFVLWNVCLLICLLFYSVSQTCYSFCCALVCLAIYRCIQTCSEYMLYRCRYKHRYRRQLALCAPKHRVQCKFQVSLNRALQCKWSCWVWESVFEDRKIIQKSKKTVHFL